MKRVLVIVVCLLVLLVIGAFLAHPLFLKPVITLVGKQTVTVPLNGEFVDPGFNIDKNNNDERLEVVGKVNTTKVGEYKLTYIVVKNDRVVKTHRTVKVIDNTSPVITLTGGESVTLCPNQKYEELGYKAIDNYDGDITKNVDIIVKNNTITYKAKDLSGNEAMVTRTIVYEDKTSPVITLNGYQNLSLIIGSAYRESGYSAIDNCDQNITNKTKVTGSVNYNVLGTYYVKYDVTDSSGNSSSVTRTVHVNNPPPPKNSTIYLTFDDGPSSVTPTVLDILKDEGIKATFFVINRSDSLNYLIKREYDEGNTVGLHTCSHNYGKVYTSVDSFFNDIDCIKNKVSSITGYVSNIIRFPGGSSNTVSNFNPGIMTVLTGEAVNRGYHYFDWNVSSADTTNISSSQVYNNIISQLGNKSEYIVLMHDYEGNGKTANALRDIIHYGKNNGYKFSSITLDTPQIHHKVNN